MSQLLCRLSYGPELVINITRASLLVKRGRIPGKSCDLCVKGKMCKFYTLLRLDKSRLVTDYLNM
ncbi:MAG: hypothetical protein DRQ04_04790 [Candidatus Hydrothermota bacterium]|nr:MAG: hypothetical protein DRQ04_04790 [Candidatus Hydrothermae bacterium]